MHFDGSLIAAAACAATAFSFGLVARRRRRADAVAATPAAGGASHRAMLDHAPMGCVVWTPDGRIVEWNRQAEHIFGWTRAQTIGRNVVDTLCREEDRARMSAASDAVFADGASSNLTLVHTTCADAAVICKWHMAALRDDDGAATHVVAMCSDITAHATARVRPSEHRIMAAVCDRDRLYREVFEHSSDALFVVEVRQKDQLFFESVNDAAAAAFGMPAQVLRGMSLGEIVAGSLGRGFGVSLAGNISHYRGCALAGVPAEYEGALDLLPPRRSGTPKFQVKLIPLAGDVGIERIIGIGRDVTLRKRYEAELLERAMLEARMSRYFENAPGCFMTLVRRPDGRYSMPFVSVGIRDTHGIDAAVVARDISKLFALGHPDDAAMTSRLAAESERNLAPFHVEYRIRHPEKGERWIECHSQPYRAADGGTVWHGFMHDVTARKQMEALLEQREREYHSLAENLPDNIARWDVAGRILFSNPTHQRTLGKPAIDMIGKMHGELFPDGRYGPVDEAIAQIVATGKPATTMRAPEIREDGEIRFHDVKLVPERAADGKIVSVLGIGRDMTDIYRMQESIAAREQEFRSLAESSPDNIVRYDLKHRHQYLNANAIRLLQLDSAEDVLGKEPYEVWPDERSAAIGKACREVLASGVAQRIETVVPVKGGNEYHQLHIVAERDTAGEIIGTLLFGRDITDLKRYAQSLLDRAKLQERVAAVAEAVPGFLFTIRVDADGHTHFPYASDGVDDLFGLRPADIRADAAVLRARYHPDDLLRIRELIVESERFLTPFRIEIRIRHPQREGEWRWIEIRSTPERQPDGATEWHGLMIDITKRKRMQDELQRSEEMFRVLVENAPDSIIRYDRAGRRIYVNRRLIELTQSSAEELLGKTPVSLKLVTDADAEILTRIIARVVATGAPDGCELTFTGANGPMIGQCALMPEFGPDGLVASVISVIRNVTAYKQALEALRLKEHALAEAQRMGNMGSWELDLVMGVLTWSDEIFRIFEIDREQFGASYAAFLAAIHPEDRDKVNAAYTESLASRAPYAIDHRLLFADGRVKHVHEHCETEYDGDGKPLRSRGTVQDISERKRMEEALRAKEREFRSLAESTPDCISRYDCAGRLTYVNGRLADQLGIPAAELIGKLPRDIWPDGRYAQIDEAVVRAMATESVVTIEICEPAADGELTHLQISVVPERDAAGQVIGTIAFGRDISALKRYAQSLLERAKLQEQIAAVAEAVPGCLFTLRIDADGHTSFPFASAGVEDLFGLSPEEIRASGAVQRARYHPDDLARHLALVDESRLALTPFRSEVRVIHPQRGQRWIESRSTPQRRPDGATEWHGLMFDITERKDLQRRLELLERAIDQSFDPVFLIDERLRFEYVNAAACRSLGYSREEFATMSPPDIDPDVTRESAAAIMDSTIAEAAVTFETHHRAKDGHVFPVEISTSLVEYDGAKHGLAVARDITERKRTDDALRFVAQRGWMGGDDDFLAALARHLGESLGVDYVVIDRMAAEPGVAETAALYAKGAIVPNMRYALKDTPCDNVMGKSLCCYAHGVQALFPADTLLVDMGAESYAGIPLWNSAGQAIGLIAVIDGKPLRNAAAVSRLLQLVATRAAAELERECAENALRQRERDFRSLAENSPDHIARFSPDGRIRYVNPRLEAVFGVPTAELAGRTLAENFPDGRCDELAARVLAAGRDGVVAEVEAAIPTPYGHRRHHSILVVPEHDAHGTIVGVLTVGRDITEHRREMRRLNLLGLAVDHLSDGVVLVNRRGAIRNANHAFAARLGYARAELIGRPLCDVVPDLAPASWEAHWQGVVARGGASLIETHNRARDGSLIPVEVAINLFEFEGEDYNLAVVRDITERKAIEAALQAAVAEAQRLAELRSDFLARMSHELRTPLNGILGYAQNLLDDATLDERQSAGLNIIRQSGDHLLTLINDILDHARIEADKLELHCDDISLASFLHTICAIVRVKAEQTNLAFVCALEADLPRVVRGDEQRLRQVLLNLLSNAVKFTDAGTVRLHVSYAAPARIRFAVRDTGIGIDAAQQEAIFQTFEQGGADSRRAGGTGLGLAISRHLVRLMGGDIAVDSRLGAGSTFSFELEMPVVAAAAEPQAAPECAADAAPETTPPQHELDVLHGLARRGNMQSMVLRAGYLTELDEAYRPFADQLVLLAKNFQSKALVKLIEQIQQRDART